MPWNRLTQFLATAALLSLAACNADYPRGQFAGYVVNHSEDEILSQVGKPVEIDNTNPDRPIWVYKKKTFNVDDYNRLDDSTLVYMKKGPSGKLVGQDVSFL